VLVKTSWHKSRPGEQIGPRPKDIDIRLAGLERGFFCLPGRSAFGTQGPALFVDLGRGFGGGSAAKVFADHPAVHLPRARYLAGALDARPGMYTGSRDRTRPVRCFSPC
jgi:hypothetical protein